MELTNKTVQRELNAAKWRTPQTSRMHLKLKWDIICRYVDEQQN